MAATCKFAVEEMRPFSKRKRVLSVSVFFSRSNLNWRGNFFDSLHVIYGNDESTYGNFFPAVGNL